MTLEIVETAINTLEVVEITNDIIVIDNPVIEYVEIGIQGPPGIPGSVAQQNELDLKANLASPTFTGTVAGITKTMVGLGSVDNTADTAKPVSTAQQTALDLKANLASPTFTGTVGGITKTMVGLGSVDNTADTAKPVSTAQQTALDLKANLASPTFTGTVAGITKTMVGLGSVDNTADTAKPVSTAQQTALDLKANLASPTFTGTVAGITKTMVGLGSVDNTADTAKPVSTAQQTALDLKANLASPTFTGTVGGITKTMVGLGSVDNTADTAKPVSTAQQTALNLKANLASPTFTGTVAGITKTMVGLGSVDNTADTAKPVSTAQQTALDLKAPIASPTFTGTVGGITKSMVGLGNVDNTTDAGKPVSTAQQTALNLKQDTSGKDATGGYAGLTLFKLNLKNAANTFTNFLTNATTAARTWTLPDKDGTVAMTSDITGTNSETNTGDNAVNSLYSGLAASKADLVDPVFTNDVAVNGQLVCARTNNTATGAGQIHLNGTSGNRIDFAAAGAAAPAIGTRSAGTKIVLYEGTPGAEFAIGIATATLWLSLSATTNSFKFYGGVTLAATLSGVGTLTLVGGLKSSNPTAGIGYIAGAGGDVTQGTSKATGVTLNKVCGTITMHAASLAANTAVAFTLTNSVLAATNNLLLNIVSGTAGAYAIGLSAMAAGSCGITLRNLTAGALAEAVQIRFSVLNSVDA